MHQIGLPSKMVVGWSAYQGEVSTGLDSYGGRVWRQGKRAAAGEVVNR
jgi:hypothetical protein